MNKSFYALVSGFLFFGFISVAQVTHPVNGIPDQRNITYAFTNATIWIDFQTKIDSATLIVSEGKISDYGKRITIPKGAVVTDLSGKWIYPSFIDPYTTYGMPESARQERKRGPQITSGTKGAYSWNQALRSETEAHRLFVANQDHAEKYRSAGFGLVMSVNTDGIARGTSTIVSLGNSKENELIVRDKAAACYSFNKGTSQQDYPTSEMGAIALLRQSFLDAKWYQGGGNKKEFNISIEAWIENQVLPQIFESENYLQSFRIDRIGDEFGVNYIVMGSGDEYKRVRDLKLTGNSYIIPLKFPEGYDVSDPYDAINMTLAELKHWETAPANAAILYESGVNFALSTYKHKEPSEFMESLRRAIQHGLPSQEALRALTATPASMLRISEIAGSLHRGKLANFIVTAGDIFEKENPILENWISGSRFVIRDSEAGNITGNYTLRIEGLSPLPLIIKGKPFQLTAMVMDLNDTAKAQVTFENNIITLKFDLRKSPMKGKYSLTGYLKPGTVPIFTGQGFNPEMKPLSWDANFNSAVTEDQKADTLKREKPVRGKIHFPNKAFGFDNLPAKETVLFRNVTVWTNENEGILKNTDVLIANGKIIRIGQNLDGTGARIIDGTGKHLTAGIIDEHSHIAVSQNVNECSHAITSEVRIGDVIDPDDINIYRQLAGGVTTSQLLHGSCNPIGGQSGLIKLRWGQNAEGMKFENAPGFIKFALGENVKQSNWGDDFRVRYPQTRMGVEQVYIDAFTRAKEYEAEWKAYNPKLKGAVTPRRDLRLEALLEIQNEKRHITCHSYQQGEINMLMKVADSLGFKVNTFTHILEGYKVADKMKAHGAGASSFSDWWGYKYEVIEAIPHNGPILQRSGVTVAYNSDDAEMARRLNQEAAKAVMYGGITEEDALKYVTLNPAKLLRIDNRVGSIKAGKDADVVLWNDHPLSVYAKALMTFIDGTCYYDASRDEMLRNEIASERSRIIKKMTDEKGKAGMNEGKKPPFHIQHLFHCMEEEEEH